MRRSSILAVLLSLVLVVPISNAQTSQPATRSRLRVLVMPFSPLNDPGKYDWLGHGIEKSLVADLATSPSVEAISGSAATVDSRAAMDEGQHVHADFVVIGTYQVFDPQVRIRGQVLDARRDAQSVLPIRATGSVQGLFQLEDRVTAQIDEAVGVEVPREIAEDLNPQGGQPSDDYNRPPDQSQYQPYDYASNPYYAPTPYSYNVPYTSLYPDYAYPAYGYYAYPGYYGGVGFGFGYRGGYSHGGYYRSGYGYHGGDYHGGGYSHGGGSAHGGGGHR